MAIPAPLETLAREIRVEHTAALASSRTSLDHAKRAGDLLNRAKDLVPHGDWETWVEQNCVIKLRTAQVYMRIAKRWDDLEAHRNAHADTPFDITNARHALTTGGVLSADDEDADASPETNGNDSRPTTGVKERTGESSRRHHEDDNAQTLTLHFDTGLELAAFLQRVEALAEHYAIRPMWTSAKVAAVIAAAYADLVQQPTDETSCALTSQPQI